MKKQTKITPAKIESAVPLSEAGGKNVFAVPNSSFPIVGVGASDRGLAVLPIAYGTHAFGKLQACQCHMEREQGPKNDG